MWKCKSKYKKGWCTADIWNTRSNVSSEASEGPSLERQPLDLVFRTLYIGSTRYTNFFIFRFVHVPLYLWNTWGNLWLGSTSTAAWPRFWLMSCVYGLKKGASCKHLLWLVYNYISKLLEYFFIRISVLNFSNFWVYSGLSLLWSSYIHLQRSIGLF